MSKACTKFWEDFDNNTMPGKYGSVMPRLSATEKKERQDAVMKIMTELGAPYWSSKYAEGKGKKKGAKKQKNEFKKNIGKVKSEVTKISGVQLDVIKKHFGKKIDYKKLQTCFELFANGKLSPREMDATPMWYYWLAFVDAAIELDIDKAIWKKLKLIITKATIIDFTRRPLKAGAPKKKSLSDAKVKKIRKRIHKGKYKNLDKEIKKVIEDYASLFKDKGKLPVLVATGKPGEWLDDIDPKTGLPVALTLYENELLERLSFDVLSPAISLGLNGGQIKLRLRPSAFVVSEVESRDTDNL